LERAIAQHPSFGYARMTLGNMILEYGDTAGAIREYDLAVAGSPTNPLLRYNYGSLLLAMGRPEGALAHLEEAARLHTGFAVALFNKARAHRLLGQTEHARTSYAEFVARAPRRLGEYVRVAQQYLASTTPGREP